MASSKMRGRVRPSVVSRDPIVWLISVFIILDFVYAVTFNLLPDGVRLQFIGMLFLGQAGLGLISLAMRLDAFRLKLAFGVLLMLAVWLASTAVLGSPFTPETALRRLAPVLAAILFIGFADKLPVRLIMYGACFTIAYAIVWAIVQPSYFHGWESQLARFAPFHGGVPGQTAEGRDNAHASAYIILSCVLIIHQSLLSGYIRHRSIAWLFIAGGAVLIGGYWSTQVQLSLVAYFGVHFAMVRRTSIYIKVFMALVFIVGVGALLLEKEVRGVEDAGVASYETGNAGTGRVGTWLDRIERIKARPASKNILGDGIETDLYTSPTWDKLTHSHNLVLTYMMETGVVGTIVFLSIVFLPLFYFGRGYYAVMTLVLAGSLVDIGITHRGMAYMLFWLAVGILALRLRSAPQTHDRAVIPARQTRYGPVTARKIPA